MASDNDSRDANEYLIRRPTVEDAVEMGQLHIAVWRETYTGMMAQDTLDQLDPDGYARMWTRIAERANDPEADGIRGTITRIAEHRPTSTLAGFSTFGPARDDDAPTPQQLWAINVLSAHQGSGVAQLLLAASIGDRPGYLWVVEQNARARRFYRRNGFVEDGVSLHDDNLGADEVRMVRF